MELPQGKYKVFRTKKYAIYYLMDDVKVEGPPEKKDCPGRARVLLLRQRDCDKAG